MGSSVLGSQQIDKRRSRFLRQGAMCGSRRSLLATSRVRRIRTRDLPDHNLTELRGVGSVTHGWVMLGALSLLRSRWSRTTDRTTDIRMSPSIATSAHETR